MKPRLRLASKFLFFLFAAIATFIGLSAGAVTTSQNVDVIVTHGAPLTTFTFVNDTGNTLPAGSPVSFGQAFRYGDIMPGTYPLIRDAATHVTLPGQQWDEISTRSENGMDGSWRHAVWTIWLPNSLASGATYQVEFLTTAGTYSESSHQPLSALCSVEPMGRLNVIGGGGVGARPDLGLTNEYAAKAFVTQAQVDWDLARLFTLGTSMHGPSTMLDESTGRISALNNGSPTGPGGSGNGTAYAGLGPLRNQIHWGGGPDFDSGFVEPDSTPPPGTTYDISGGTLNGGTGLDHMPAFDGIPTYAIFGDRFLLDLMQWNGERDFLQARIGPGPLLGMGYYRDNNAVGPDGQTHHYWGLTSDGYQGRGAAWLTRDVLLPASFGADGTPERQVFADIAKETSNYWPLFSAYMDGPNSTGFTNSINPKPLADSCCEGALFDFFIDAYWASVSYWSTTLLHTPAAKTWSRSQQIFMEAICGLQAANHPPTDYYCIDYNEQPAIHDGSAIQNPGNVTGASGNIGQAWNGVDAADFGSWDQQATILSGGVFQALSASYVYTNGDTAKFIWNGWQGIGGNSPIDQLPGNRWFTLMNVNNANSSYQLQCTSADHAAYPSQCPTAGGPFTSFTRGGAAISLPESGENPKFRLQYDPGQNSNYVDPTYAPYGSQIINGLAVLGYDVSHAIANFNFRCGPLPNGGDCQNPTTPQYNWDASVVVPGLPSP